MSPKFLGGFMAMAGVFLLLQACSAKVPVESFILVIIACVLGGYAMLLVLQ